ncbi:MAG: chitobiase/beta-hexosaminidase C-terminal domain-containing protein [Clostridia bacterium]|nr:chitobiase/beta-hexosaminidase C-terminal domain-containing protein [Clostridia bacterium]
MKKKIISLILSTIFVLSSFSAFGAEALALEEIKELTFSGLTDNDKETLKNGGKISSPVTSRLPEKKTSNKVTFLPEEFAVDYVDKTGDQGDMGTCWAFAALTSSETGLGQKGNDTILSEAHLSYFAYSSMNQRKAFTNIFSGYDPYNNGGFDWTACDTLANWYGPAPAEDFPYKNGKISDSFRDTSVAHMQNMISFPEYEYTGDEEQLKARRVLVEQVKEQMVKTGQAVDISYLAADRDVNFNKETNAWYNPTGDYTNHSVTIVGWDDNFPKESFNNSETILNDGAWLVQNSWGEAWGMKGFFWLSYEDVTIDYIGIYLYESKDNYENIYSHDESVQYTPVGFDDSTEIFMANVFASKRQEVLEAVSFYTTDVNTEYRVEIYTDVTDKDDPTSGTLKCKFSGKKELPGYYTEQLEKGIDLEKGKKFSIVVYLKNPTVTLTAQVEAIYMEYRVQSTANVSAAGESFVSQNGEEWEDIHQKIIKGFDGLTDYMRLGNFAIKAFTSESKYVKFSLDSGEVPVTEKLELSCLSADEIYYTTDGTDPCENGTLYTAPFSIADKMTVKAVAKDENGFGKVYTNEYTQAITALESLVFTTEKTETEVDLTEKSHETILVEHGCKSVGITAESYYDISINGIFVPSGETLQIPVEEYTANPVEIIVEESGYKSYTYSFKVFVNPIDYDYDAETILFDETRVSVKTKYYKTVQNGDSVTEWIDSPSTMTFIVEVGEEGFLCQLPGRKSMIIPQINYIDECSVEKFGERVYYKFSETEEFCEENSVEYDNIPAFPGETMYLYREAGDGKFASPVVKWMLPSRPEIEISSIPKKIGRVKVVFEEVEGLLYYCEETDSYSEDTFIKLTPGEKYTFTIRKEATEESFASEKKVFEITTNTDDWFENLKKDIEAGENNTSFLVLLRAFFARFIYRVRMFFMVIFE